MGRGRDAGWVAAVAAAVAATALGAMLPASSDLVTETYPTPLCEIRGQSIEKAFTQARFEHDFEDEPVFQHVSTVFTAKVVYGADEPLDGPKLDIACQNVAVLDFDPEEWEVDNLTPARQDLGDAVPVPGDRQALVWQWEVTPVSAGTLSFDVDIQPIVIVKNKERSFKGRNEPVHIEVRVHANAEALAEVSERARDLDVEIPEMTAGSPSEVRARLPLLGHDDVVAAELGLAQGEHSVPTSIRAMDATSNNGEVVRTWSVEPSEPGAVNLTFTVNLSTQVGEETLEAEVTREASAIAVSSWWDRFKGLVALLGAVLAAVVAGLAVWKHFFGPGETGGGGGPTNGTPGPTSGVSPRLRRTTRRSKRGRQSTSPEPEADGPPG